MIGCLVDVGVLRKTRGVGGGVNFLAETFLTKPHLDKSSFHKALIDVLRQIGEDLMTEYAKTHRIILGDGWRWSLGKETHGGVHQRGWGWSSGASVVRYLDRMLGQARCAG